MFWENFLLTTLRLLPIFWIRIFCFVQLLQVVLLLRSLELMLVLTKQEEEEKVKTLINHCTGICGFSLLELLGTASVEGI